MASKHLIQCKSVFVNPLVANHPSNWCIKSALLLNDEWVMISFTWDSLSKYVLWSNKLLPARTAVPSVPAHKCRVTELEESNHAILSWAAWNILFPHANSYFHIPKLSVTAHVFVVDVDSGVHGVAGTASLANIHVQLAACIAALVPNVIAAVHNHRLVANQALSHLN